MRARVPVVLVCSVCGSRNYRTTRSMTGTKGPLQLSKFCPTCKQHTLHRESK